jgi:CubicO group peptidase (beta-lactamase class C family)
MGSIQLAQRVPFCMMIFFSMKRSKLLAGLCVPLTAGVLAAQNGRAADQRRQIDHWVSLYHNLGQFDGAVLVAVNGRVVYTGAYGEANREWHNLHTPDVRFRIGSITKAFTGTLALRLAEKGTLRLDAKVADYLPKFRRSLGEQITLRQLLTHTSGLPDFNSFPDFFNQVQAGLLTEDQVLERIGQYELLSPPGTKFSYSNDAYVLLGAVIAAATGKSYEAALDEYILRPAGLASTMLNHSDRIIARRANGYRRILGGFENVIPYAADAAAGLISTVGDLFRWDEALYGTSLVSESSKTLMWSISPHGNAYGWLVSRRAAPATTTDSILVVKGDGAIPGFYALTLRVPSRHIFIAALTNNRGPKNYLPDMGNGILGILYGVSPGSPIRSLADVLRRDIPAVGAPKLLENYRAAVARGEIYEVEESHINSVGYLAMRSGRLRDALTVFQFNAERFPNSWNVYDSWGDALLEAGQREEAIAKYRKALELAPNNSAIVEKLRKLMADTEHQHT